MPAPVDAPSEGTVGPPASRFARVRSEVTRFLVAGGLAYAVDVLVFNLCLSLGMGGVGAKITSSIPATIVAYVGNRYWTYRHRDRTGVGREYTLFFVFSAIAAGIQASSVFVSHTLMGYESKLADNISANIVGMALGTLFRFWAFRTWVFKHKRPDPVPVAEGGMS
ncbi:GtrA family protein [Embleya hyalina]|uniref:Membrane protein n=1 Tax=Embleya hyalina TaxID=516124 RepID=A0A401Z3U7_9ACTN|nr:GtrA family protein [Embleya hyalina]GCE01518.1 membrane protein [Embleya hyalina]